MQATGTRQGLVDLAVVDSLPSPPVVALEILRLSREPDTGLAELAAVLSNDAALVTKVIRVANSVVYRRRSDVVSVNDAAARIGLRSLQVIALGFSLIRDLPKTGAVGGLDLDQYWRRSVTVAVLGRRLAARSTPEVAQEAFIVGLFAHVGRLVLAQYVGALYQPVCTDAGGWPSIEDERTHLGVSNVELGALLLERWQLPSMVVDAIRSIDPTLDSGEANPDLHRSVTSALAVDSFLNEPRTASSLDRIDAVARDLLGSSATAEDLLEGASVELAETLELFDLGGDPTMVDADALLAESRQLLVASSIELAEALDAEQQTSHSLRREVQELQERVREDSLTRLPNRSALDEFLRTEMDLRRRGNRHDAIGILLIDIDRFKRLNDAHGHQVGDDVLRLVAATLSAGCRHGELLARYGGEEFLLVVPSCSVTDLHVAGERLRTDVEQLSIGIGDISVSVTVSVGGACARDAESMEDADRLIQRADGYLYRAKRRGRNRTEVSPEDLL